MQGGNRKGDPVDDGSSILDDVEHELKRFRNEQETERNKDPQKVPRCGKSTEMIDQIMNAGGGAEGEIVQKGQARENESEGLHVQVNSDPENPLFLEELRRRLSAEEKLSRNAESSAAMSPKAQNDDTYRADPQGNGMRRRQAAVSSKQNVHDEKMPSSNPQESLLGCRKLLNNAGLSTDFADLGAMLLPSLSSPKRTAQNVAPLGSRASHAFFPPETAMYPPLYSVHNPYAVYDYQAAQVESNYAAFRAGFMKGMEKGKGKGKQGAKAGRAREFVASGHGLLKDFPAASLKEFPTLGHRNCRESQKVERPRRNSDNHVAMTRPMLVEEDMQHVSDNARIEARNGSVARKVRGSRSVTLADFMRKRENAGHLETTAPPPGLDPPSVLVNPPDLHSEHQESLLRKNSSAPRLTRTVLDDHAQIFPPVDKYAAVARVQFSGSSASTGPNNAGSGNYRAPKQGSDIVARREAEVAKLKSFQSYKDVAILREKAEELGIVDELPQPVMCIIIIIVLCFIIIRSRVFKSVECCALNAIDVSI